MKNNEYEVILTNGTVKDYYTIFAKNETEATILAQAKAINLGRGYEVVSVSVEI